jgi:hypothetical protein
MRRVPVSVDIQSPIGGAWIAAQVPLKRTIWVRPGISMTKRLIAHELRHVVQAETRPWPLAYFWQWLTTGRNYWTMPFEREARAAETDPFYLQWAEEVIDGFRKTPVR